MRKSKQCPKCECKKLVNIAVVADSTTGGQLPAYLAIRFEGHSFMGNEKKRCVGKLEAVTCSECGYTEYYVENPKEIEPDGKNITWLT